MSVENHYLGRIATATENLARELKELSILMQETIRLLMIIANNTKKAEIEIDNTFTKGTQAGKIVHYNEATEEEIQFSKAYLQELLRESDQGKKI